MASPLSYITLVPFNYFSLFYLMALVITAHVIGFPFVFFVILLANLYEHYLEHRIGKYFQRIFPYFEKFTPILNGFISREKITDHEKMAVSIVFDSLNNREEVIEQVRQFVQLQINSSEFERVPSVSEELLFQRSSSQNDLKCSEKQVRMTSASPLIVSFPGKPVDVVTTILKTFASLRIESKQVDQIESNQIESNQIESNQIESNQTNDFIKMVSDQTISFFFNLLPLTEESKKRLMEIIDMMEIPKLVQMTIDLVQKVTRIVQSSSIIVNMVVEKCLVWNRSSSRNPRRESEPFDLTRGFCDPLPRELVDLLKEKTNKDSEVLVLSILSGALSSYLRLMRGETVESVDIDYGKWRDMKVQITLPLKSSSTMKDELLFLDHVSNLHSRSKDSTECLERNLSLVKNSLPSNIIYNTWYENLILPLTQNDTSQLEVQNLYLSSDSSSMINPLVKSLYLWNEVESSKVPKLRILVIHREEGITVTLSGIKNDPIESASLLAECIVKSVASLCYNLDIKWDRRSPPSTPVSDT